MTRAQIVAIVLDWFADHRRDLPWRSAEVTPWGVLVSEVMLQQTPVSRVEPVWRQWLQRWPEPAELADEATGAAVAAWGRLGYPRRALRLHAAAVAITEDYDGRVPSQLDDLLALPGVGEYTAAAVASFAFGQRHLVLDTNVRRLLTRLDLGQPCAPTHLTQAERERAAAWLPATTEQAAVWAVASMELGALICTARNPDCEHCPVARHCRWLANGRPAHTGPPRRGQTWAGTDRQCRGRLLALVRESPTPVTSDELLAEWPQDRAQAERCLAGLTADGLIQAGAQGFVL